MSGKKWQCAICGGEVVEGQRFTFIPGKGAVHVECLNTYALGKAKDKVKTAALLDANEVLLYAITRLKEAAKLLEGEAKEAVDEARKAVEKSAGKLANILAKEIEE